MEDYTKAVNLLTISNDKSKLEKQVKELSEKGKDSEYIIQGKLREKDNEIKEMKEQIQLLKQSQKEIVECLKHPDKIMQISQEE